MIKQEAEKKTAVPKKSPEKVSPSPRLQTAEGWKRTMKRKKKEKK